ncbi:MAG: transposase [Chloroflexota bacterium]
MSVPLCVVTNQPEAESAQAAAQLQRIAADTGLTMADVARGLGLKPETVRTWRRQRPRPSNPGASVRPSNHAYARLLALQQHAVHTALAMPFTPPAARRRWWLAPNWPDSPLEMFAAGLDLYLMRLIDSDGARYGHDHLAPPERELAA